MCVSCLFVQCFVSFHLDGEKLADCFTLFVFLMSCDCHCCVALPLAAVCWSALCGCGIS